MDIVREPIVLRAVRIIFARPQASRSTAMWHPFSSRTRSTSRRPRNSRARRTSLERLEERTLLSYADFELSSLLPANGGDGSKGFVVSGIVDGGALGHPVIWLPFARRRQSGRRR